MTPAERAAGEVFRQLRPEVTEAAYSMVEATLSDPEPLLLTDALLGATLAALLERGWLQIPTTERRTA